jgi:hypothetical protein
MATETLRDYAFAILPGEANPVARENAVREYEKARERYARDGKRGAYMEALFALGFDAARIRFLVANPGRGIVIMY